MRANVQDSIGKNFYPRGAARGVVIKEHLTGNTSRYSAVGDYRAGIGTRCFMEIGCSATTVTTCATVVNHNTASSCCSVIKPDAAAVRVDDRRAIVSENGT